MLPMALRRRSGLGKKRSLPVALLLSVMLAGWLLQEQLAAFVNPPRPPAPSRIPQAEVGKSEGTALEASDRDLSLLLASQFPVFVAVGALIPVLPLYGQEFGLSQSSVGLLVSSPSLAKLLLNLPFGQLADQLGRKALMVGGMALCALADVGTGLAQSLPFLIVARLLLGTGLSSSDAGSSAWVADATEARPETRASFLGVQNAVIACAFVLGPAVGGWLVGEFGLRSIFFVVAFGAATCATGYSFLPELRRPTDPSGAKEATSSFQELLKAPEQQALAAISVAFYAGTACKISLLPAVARETFDAAPAEVGQLFSALAALAILGTLAGGRLADALGPRIILLCSGTVCAAAYYGAALATEAKAKEAFVGCLALWALAAAIKSPALQAFAIAAAPENQRGAALSVPKTVGDLSYLIAPFLLGTLDDTFGPEAALTCCATTFLLGTLAFAVLAVKRWKLGGLAVQAVLRLRGALNSPQPGSRRTSLSSRLEEGPPEPPQPSRRESRESMEPRTLVESRRTSHEAPPLQATGLLGLGPALPATGPERKAGVAKLPQLDQADAREQESHPPSGKLKMPPVPMRLEVPEAGKMKVEASRNESKSKVPEAPRSARTPRLPDAKVKAEGGGTSSGAATARAPATARAAPNSVTLTAATIQALRSLDAPYLSSYGKSEQRLLSAHTTATTFLSKDDSRTTLKEDSSVGFSPYASQTELHQASTMSYQSSVAKLSSYSAESEKHHSTEEPHPQHRHAQQHAQHPHPHVPAQPHGPHAVLPTVERIAYGVETALLNPKGKLIGSPGCWTSGLSKEVGEVYVTTPGPVLEIRKSRMKGHKLVASNFVKPKRRLVE
ncbi:Quinolone resistance protein NorA, partial [Durusdinium trenchii]